jgi:hypothetical protein
MKKKSPSHTLAARIVLRARASSNGPPANLASAAIHTPTIAVASTGVVG